VSPRGQVLVVDDEPAIRALVARIVERAGLTVDTARDGGDAIDKLRAQPYEVVVLDMMMPRVNGADVIAFLGHLRERPTVIVISAGDPVELRKLDPAVVQSIIRKPFEIDALADLVTAAVRSRESAEGEEGEGGRLLDFPSRLA
jgi:DNA-binding response OmpR family regulator